MPSEQEDEEELASARQKKLSARYSAMQKQQEQEEQKRAIAQGLLTTEAYERIMNVRIANPELYEKVLGIIAYLAQNKQLKSKVTEGDLKKILAKLTERRETSIEFKSK